MSLISPATIPQDQAPASMSPSTRNFVNDVLEPELVTELLFLFKQTLNRCVIHDTFGIA
jgi:hypothetical protein